MEGFELRKFFDEDHRLATPPNAPAPRARAPGGVWSCMAARRRDESSSRGRTLAKNAEGSDGDHEAGTGRLAEPRAMQQHGWKG